MYDAARRAAIHDTIMKFPEKYSTVVGERGLKVREMSKFFHSSLGIKTLPFQAL